MENKIPFYKTDEGKVLSHGMHDHCGATCYLSAILQVIEIKLNKGTFTLEDLPERIEKIKNAMDRQEKSIDYIYKYFKDKYEENNNDIS